MSSPHQLQQYKSCLKSFLLNSGSFEIPYIHLWANNFDTDICRSITMPKKGKIHHFNEGIYASRNVCVKDIGPWASMILQNYQNFIEMTWNIIYSAALWGGFKCPRKIHLNTQQGLGEGGNCPPCTVCSNGFYADIWSQHQVHQYKSCLKSFLKFFGSFELP